MFLWNIFSYSKSYSIIICSIGKNDTWFLIVNTFAKNIVEGQNNFFSIIKNLRQYLKVVGENLKSFCVNNTLA